MLTTADIDAKPHVARSARAAPIVRAARKHWMATAGGAIEMRDGHVVSDHANAVVAA